MESKYKKFFETHPTIDKVFDVGGALFTERKQADAHAKSIDAKVETINRSKAGKGGSTKGDDKPKNENEGDK